MFGFADGAWGWAGSLGGRSAGVWALHGAVVAVVLAVAGFFGGEGWGVGRVDEYSEMVSRVPARERYCDSILRSQLVFQRNSSTYDRFQEVVRVIQDQRSDVCGSDVWAPVVSSSPAVSGGCFDSVELAAVGGGPDSARVGTLVVPSGLMGENGRVRRMSGRDMDNNVLVYWSLRSGERPDDGSLCWLYVARLSTWTEEYSW